MGADCEILLPPAVRVGDVADVMSALAGNPMIKNEFVGGWSARADGVKVSPYNSLGLESCVRIALVGKLVDNEGEHEVMYHFEGGKQGERLISPRSTAFWICICRGLADFFGGSVGYSDRDSSKPDYVMPEQPDIHAEDNEEWNQLQCRKLAVKAITPAQLKEAAQWAAYR